MNSNIGRGDGQAVIILSDNQVNDINKCTIETEKVWNRIYYWLGKPD